MPANRPASLPTDSADAGRGGHRGHAEEDTGAGFRHRAGPARCQDATDGATGLCGAHGEPGTAGGAGRPPEAPPGPCGHPHEPLSPGRDPWRWPRYFWQRSQKTPNSSGITTSCGSVSRTSARSRPDPSEPPNHGLFAFLTSYSLSVARMSNMALPPLWFS